MQTTLNYDLPPLKEKVTPNGHYTIVLENGNHRTFKLSTVRHGPLEGRQILGYLRGSNNETDYTNFAFVRDGQVFIWKKYRDNSGVNHLAKLFGQVILNPAEAGKNYGLASGHCYRCNRLLTDPVSIAHGIGPECRKKG